jgi:hypothetical protein
MEEGGTPLSLRRCIGLNVKDSTLEPRARAGRKPVMTSKARSAEIFFLSSLLLRDTFANSI